jgi:hypothetical protein
MDATDGLVPILPRLHPLVERPHILSESLPICVHCDAIGAYRRICPKSAVRTSQRLLVNEVGQRKDALPRMPSCSFRYLQQSR